MTNPERAAMCLKFLTRTSRPNEPDEKIVIQADNAPDWFGDLCYSCHDDMMPDDWRYEFIEDALSAIESDDDGVDLDSSYPYTADRLNWLASTLTRKSYCDEAAKECGVAFTDGMQFEMAQVYNLVLNWLDEHDEIFDPEETDDGEDSPTSEASNAAASEASDAAASEASDAAAGEAKQTRED